MPPRRAATAARARARAGAAPPRRPTASTCRTARPVSSGLGSAIGGQYIDRVLPLPLLLERALAPLAAVPSRCAVCRAWGDAALCADCVRCHAAPRPRCERCAIEVPAGVASCGACLKAPHAFGRAVAAVAYDAPWDGLIARFKFRDGLDLSGDAGRAPVRCRAARRAPSERRDLLLPVPLAAGRLRERGYNQAWELARRVARRLRRAGRRRLLLRTRETAHQIALPLDRRAANVRGAFGRRAASGAPARRPPRGAGRRRDDHRRHARRGGARAAARRRRVGRGVGGRAHAAPRRRLNRPPAAAPMFHIVLVHPEIPPNTGNVIRLAANTGCSAAPGRAARLLDGRPPAQARRARLPRVRAGAPPRVVERRSSTHARPPRSACTPSRRAARAATARWPGGRGDWLVFGSESRGPAGSRCARLRRRAAGAPADAPRPAQPQPRQRGRGGGVRGVAAAGLRGRRLSDRRPAALPEQTPLPRSGAPGAALFTRAPRRRRRSPAPSGRARERISPASASGAVPAALKYCASSFWRTSSLLMMRTSSLRQPRRRSACGVAAGASTACHEIASKPGKPCSASVGSSASDATRPSVVTPSAFSLPARTWPMAMPGTMKPACTCPTRMALTTCGKPW